MPHTAVQIEVGGPLSRYTLGRVTSGATLHVLILSGKCCVILGEHGQRPPGAY
jgi:hypothetical protein